MASQLHRHVHQLDALGQNRHLKPSIMSISGTLYGHLNPSIMSISWTLLGRQTPQPQHHEHQLDAFGQNGHRNPSIMSISCTLLGRADTSTPASRASAGCFWAERTPQAQHHVHQLDAFGQDGHLNPSIMSISWTLLGRTDTPPPVSRAPAGRFWAERTLQPQHHEHQLDAFGQNTHLDPSIMSISWTRSGRTDTSTAAS